MNTHELEKTVAGILKKMPSDMPKEYVDWFEIKLKGMYIVGYNEGKKSGVENGFIEGRDVTLKQCSAMYKIFGSTTKAKIDDLIRMKKKS